jgi:putative hydrolase of the HAD superfamily
MGLGFFAFADIKAIVFDYGGVLTDVVDKSKLNNYIQKTFQLSNDELVTTSKKFKESKMTEEVFYAKLAKDKNLVLSPNWFSEFEETMAKSINLNPKMLMLVKNIKERGYKVAIFSNMRKPLDEYLRKLGHYDGFDPVVLSSEIGCEKPESNAYKILMEKLNLKADEFIFVDDRLENIEGAKSLEIDSIQFKSVENLKEELAKRKIF